MLIPYRPMLGAPSARTSLHSRPRARRAFTLIELMAVVAIIAIAAALATPSFLKMMQDRRSQKDALALLVVLQDAHARAMGRGGAVRLDYDQTQAGGRELVQVFEMFDDLDGDGNFDLPSPACNAIASPRIKSMSGIGTFTARTRFELTLNGAATNTVRLCFSPRGKTFFFDTVNNVWVPLVNAMTFTVTPLESGAPIPGAAVRRIFVSPSGDAQMLM